MSDDGEAQRGVVLSGLAAVLVEDDVQGQVQVILDAPWDRTAWRIAFGSGSIEATKNLVSRLSLPDFLSIRLSVIASSERKPFHLG